MTFRFDEKTVKRSLAVDLAFAEARLRAVGALGVMFVFRSGDKPEDLLLMPSGWRDDTERDLIIRVVQLVCVARNIRMATMMSEAWMRDVAVQPGESRAASRERAYAVRPSQAKDRIEVVSVATAWREDNGNRRVLASMRTIERTADGAFAGLKPVAIVKDNVQTESWLSALVVPEDVPERLRVMAEAAVKAAGVRLEAAAAPTLH